MAALKLLQADGRSPAFGTLREKRTAHSAETDDRDINTHLK